MHFPTSYNNNYECKSLPRKPIISEKESIIKILFLRVDPPIFSINLSERKPDVV